MNRNTTKETIFRVLIMCGSILLAVPYLRDMLAQPDLFRFIWILFLLYLIFYLRFVCFCSRDTVVALSLFLLFYAERLPL